MTGCRPRRRRATIHPGSRRSFKNTMFDPMYRSTGQMSRITKRQARSNGTSPPPPAPPKRLSSRQKVPIRRMVPERWLKSFDNMSWAAHAPTGRHGERQARSRAWMATGEPLLSSRRRTVPTALEIRPLLPSQPQPKQLGEKSHSAPNGALDRHGNRA